MNQKITNHLWFDKEAKEAADFYISVFGGTSEIKHISHIHDTPSGPVDIIDFDLFGQRFTAISAGPIFTFNPSISFSIACNTKDEVDELWKKLAEGGKVLMELGPYPFSKRYGWVQDKYGLSWQLISMEKIDITQKITPVLMFANQVCGKAEEAMQFYVSVFKHAEIGNIFRYTKSQKPDKEGTVAHAFFMLEHQQFAAMDSAKKHNFNFNEAISFMIHCENQEEIDYYWQKLSAVPESEQCGWLKDRYGLSWQVVPILMSKMMEQGTKEQIARVTQAFLHMKKFDIAILEKAYKGK